MERNDYDSQINAMLFSAESFIPNENLPALPYMKLAQTVHDWYDFEHQIWEIGEEIRQLVLSAHKELNIEQSDRVCKICLETKAKRGRQSFVMLLGKKRYAIYAENLASMLSDEDINGHIISSLYKMGASQYSKQILPYTTHKIVWIRNEAKRYIQKHGLPRA